MSSLLFIYTMFSEVEAIYALELFLYISSSLLRERDSIVNGDQWQSLVVSKR